MQRHSAAADRNKGPILDVLRRVLPAEGLVLEVASGTGQHVAHFAAALPGLEWQPSDADAGALESIRAAAEGVGNVRAPILLDVHARPWPVARADAIVCSNMIHISPWEATLDLFAGARDLAPAVVFLYGPYKRGGVHTAPSNEAFDADLRARNPQWGLRDLEAVASVAAASGFELSELVAMPANNLSLVFKPIPHFLSPGH